MALIIQIKNIKYTLFYQFTNTTKQRKGPFCEISKAYSKDMLLFLFYCEGLADHKIMWDSRTLKVPWKPDLKQIILL